MRARVEGTVQGVGFRPHVHRLAVELGLGGFVLNDELGVLLEVEGAPEGIDSFVSRLCAEAPPLAGVERISLAELAPSGESSFAIVESASSGEPLVPVSADTATCAECLAELFDPADRRFRYPFVNCTNCGPRFTIVRGVPYDRPLTTMAGFEMCARCRAEYDDPLDRRFHAQPNACRDCGPRARLADARGRAVEVDGSIDAIAASAAALLDGMIVAVKGVGGFHLAARADDEGAVARLRARKHREDKPLAIMAPDLEQVRRLVELDEEEESLLLARERSIVLARRRPAAAVAQAVAPGLPDLGVMLPYSPLHHLLLADAATALVMTSGNVSDEPIAYREDDALERLGGIADLFLLHDRPIETRTDDSVARMIGVGPLRRPLLLRRSRGHVPASVDLPLEAPAPLLACGAELKNTFCVAKGTRAWVGHHVGDLKNYETLRSFSEGIQHFERLFAVAPEIVAHDLHPDYLSTAYALEREGVEHVGVQHHHAHLAACLAEHGEQGAAVGAIYDGTGHGTDGTAWGGEILVGGLVGFERVGHLHPVRLPGGERAIREPWRMACAWLVEARGEADGPPPIPAAIAGRVDPKLWSTIAEMATTGFSAPVTTSIGRLFDAVAALCGIRLLVNYEGQAAIELEAAAGRSGGNDEGNHQNHQGRDAYPMPLLEEAGDAVLLDARETIQAVVRDVGRGIAAPQVAARFHAALAEATARACARAARRSGTETVVLSGGVFQNRLLLEWTAERLVRDGLRVLTPTLLPPNDGGIAYGQAAVAAARLAARRGAVSQG